VTANYRQNAAARPIGDMPCHLCQSHQQLYCLSATRDGYDVTWRHAVQQQELQQQQRAITRPSIMSRNVSYWRWIA